MKSFRRPAGFKGTLRPYQLRGFSWLGFLRQYGLGACLADDMGLGKTIQALALLERDHASGVDRPVLLVCPTSVVGNWRKEAARFAPGLPVLVHHGLSRARGEEFAQQAARHALVISSYALMHRDLDMSERDRVVRNHSRRGAEHQEPGDAPVSCRAIPDRRLQDRPHGHAGREQRRRAVVHHGLPEPRLSR